MDATRRAGQPDHEWTVASAGGGPAGLGWSTVKGPCFSQGEAYSPTIDEKRSATTGADGGYTLTGLPAAADYQVCFILSGASRGGLGLRPGCERHATRRMPRSTGR